MANYLVVGGSSGIGKRITELLSATGNGVFATYRSHPVEPSNDGVQYFPVDVTAEGLTMDFLPDTLDGLVYCPGTISLRPFERIKPQDFTNDFQLQVTGAVKVLQAALPALRKGSNPSIILFSTLAVQTGLPYHSQVSASKGAIEGLVRALAAELAPTIRVNGVAPSLIDTPLAANLLNTDQKRENNAQRHPLKRIGTTDDIASMVEFLLSEKASWITGQVLHVDGGLSTLKV